MGSYRDLVKRRDIRRILIPIVPGRLAYTMVGLSFFFHAKDSSNSLAVAGFAIGVYTLVSSAGAVLRGHAIDRFGQGKPLWVLVPSYCAALLVTAFAHGGSLLTIIMAGVVGLVAPPLNLSIRQLYKIALPPEEVRTAWALDTVINNATAVAGPAVATTICVQLSPTVSLVTTAVLMAFGGIGLVTAPLSKRWVPEAREAGGVSLFRTKAIWVIAFEGMAVGLGLGALDVAVPSSATLHHNAQLAAPLLAVFALGSILGGLIAGAKLKGVPPMQALMVCSVLSVVLISPLALTTPGLVMGLVIFLAGVMEGPAQILIIEIIDIVRPRGAAATAQGWIWALEGSMAAAGSAIAGSLADHFGSGAALGFVSAAVVLSPICLWAGRKSVFDALAANKDRDVVTA